ncbi:MAG: hypothetical protein IJ604_12815 [Prevotella sp.]|nr:hypothetical protein [Prevotella sp.]
MIWLNWQKNVVYGSLSPYKIIETDPLDYSFTTRDGIKYRAYFLSASHLHPMFQKSYSFNIEPEGDVDETTHSLDARIGVTIFEILRSFFRHYENSMLMACDTLDGKEGKRRKRFDRWFKTYNDGSVLKMDAALDCDEYKLFVSMFISKHNPMINELVDAFNELIKTDLYHLAL